MAIGSYLAKRGLVQLGSYRARHDSLDPHPHRPKPKPSPNPNPSPNPTLPKPYPYPQPYITRHDIWDLVFVNASHLHLNLTAWQGSGRAQWGAKYLRGATTKAPTSKG